MASVHHALLCSSDILARSAALPCRISHSLSLQEASTGSQRPPQHGQRDRAENQRQRGTATVRRFRLSCYQRVNIGHGSSSWHDQRLAAPRAHASVLVRGGDGELIETGGGGGAGDRAGCGV